jgi:hypothetical protein
MTESPKKIAFFFYMVKKVALFYMVRVSQIECCPNCFLYHNHANSIDLNSSVDFNNCMIQQSEN